MMVLDHLADAKYRLTLKRVVDIGFRQFDYMLDGGFGQLAKSFLERISQRLLKFMLEVVLYNVGEEISVLAPAA